MCFFLASGNFTSRSQISNSLLSTLYNSTAATVDSLQQQLLFSAVNSGSCYALSANRNSSVVRPVPINLSSPVRGEGSAFSSISPLSPVSSLSVSSPAPSPASPLKFAGGTVVDFQGASSSRPTVFCQVPGNMAQVPVSIFLLFYLIMDGVCHQSSKSLSNVVGEIFDICFLGFVCNGNQLRKLTNSSSYLSALFFGSRW